MHRHLFYWKGTLFRRPKAHCRKCPATTTRPWWPLWKEG